VSENPPSVY